jgi:hypothetical protein
MEQDGEKRDVVTLLSQRKINILKPTDYLMD